MGLLRVKKWEEKNMPADLADLAAADLADLAAADLAFLCIISSMSQ